MLTWHAYEIIYFSIKNSLRNCVQEAVSIFGGAVDHGACFKWLIPPSSIK